MTTERKLPSKEEWEQIERAAFTGIYGHVKLTVDDYEITLARELSKITLSTMVYVNGSFKGKWLMKDEEGAFPIAKRFFFTKTKSLMTKKQKAGWLKVFGRSKRQLAKVNEKLVFKVPYFNNFNTFKRHLLKENHHIELLEENT